jgi:hypothetical protein
MHRITTSRLLLGKKDCGLDLLLTILRSRVSCAHVGCQPMRRSRVSGDWRQGSKLGDSVQSESPMEVCCALR